MMNYDEWYTKIGYSLADEYEAWLNECPESFLTDDLPTVEEYLYWLYKSQLGDYEDRCYDEWKERDII